MEHLDAVMVEVRLDSATAKRNGEAEELGFLAQPKMVRGTPIVGAVHYCADWFHA